jgi:SlyX protein
MTDTSRLEALETRIAHHEQMIDDLNQTITAQWKDIDRLKREIERLGDRVASAAPPCASRWQCVCARE